MNYREYITKVNDDLSDKIHKHFKIECLQVIKDFEEKYHNHKLHIFAGGMGTTMSFTIYNKRTNFELDYDGSVNRITGKFISKFEMLDALNDNMDAIQNHLWISLGELTNKNI